MYYVVTYTGKFGYIKPWTAVRDAKTFSQQFLTPSIIEGIEKKLFPELLQENGCISRICRHKLRSSSIAVQTEQTQTRGWNRKSKLMCRPKSILTRGVLLDPVLLLAFASEEDARRASVQHVCLCRNEDILLPLQNIEVIDDQDFQNMKGFELRFGRRPGSFLVGYNRYNGEPMYGWLEIDGRSII